MEFNQIHYILDVTVSTAQDSILVIYLLLSWISSRVKCLEVSHLNLLQVLLDAPAGPPTISPVLPQRELSFVYKGWQL